jgi:hypothetical protein
LRARRERPPCGGTTGKCDEFPSPHGLAPAEDYIGYEKSITFLDRELRRSLHPSEPLPCPLWVNSGHCRV